MHPTVTSFKLVWAESSFSQEREIHAINGEGLILESVKSWSLSYGYNYGSSNGVAHQHH